MSQMIKWQNANDNKCSLQETIKGLEVDRAEFGEFKARLRRIEELEKENESQKLKGKKSFELQKSFEEKIVHLEKEIATFRDKDEQIFDLRKKIVIKDIKYSEKLRKLEADEIQNKKGTF